MNFLDLFQTTFTKALQTLLELWSLLLLSVLVGVSLQLYVDKDRVARFLFRNRRNSVLMSTALAVGTPFCSCGTTAVVIGMLASTVPWAPIVAFMVASPLTSPEGLFYNAGLFGWPFSIAFMLASILLGISGGALAAFIEGRGWLKGQARLVSRPEVALPVNDIVSPSARPRLTLQAFAREFFNLSWKMLAMFLGFSFIGYFLNGLIPQAWIESAFGRGQAFSVPLAALLGVPFYLNTEASMPLVRAFIDSGMSPGAALAFLITGSGTSIGALTGALTIARWRVIALVVGTLVVGAMLVGVSYDLAAIIFL